MRLLLFFLLYSSYCFGQLTIAPEIGLSYIDSGLNLRQIADEGPPDNTRYSFGLSVSYPVAEVLRVGVRSVYVTRPTSKSWTYIEDQDYISSEYRQNDLDFDLELKYLFMERFNLVGGYAITNKVNSEVIHTFSDRVESTEPFSNRRTGWLVGLDYCTRFVDLQFRYINYGKEDLMFIGTWKSSRFDFSVAYPINFGKRK